MIYLTMIACVLILLTIWDSTLMGCYVGAKRKLDSNIAKYHKSTGQPIAAVDFLRIYENEHFHFYLKEAKESNVLRWPLLERKDLNECCLRYLYSIIPTVEIKGVTGTMDVAIIQYWKEIIQDFPTRKSYITLVKCERWNQKGKYYYMARAPESHCFYTLLRDMRRFFGTFIIIYKHCGIEWPTDSSTSLVPHVESKEFIEKLQRRTGQPITLEKNIFEYEREHRELFQKEAVGDSLSWPYIIGKKNLSQYCSQYLQKCNPRITGTVNGVPTKELIHYQCEKQRNHFHILTIKCVVKRKVERLFYISRAPENNCVYALIRRKCSKRGPFNIVFKHCDFEDLEKKKRDITESNVLPNLHVQPNHEMKVEGLGIWENSNVTIGYNLKKEDLCAPKLLQLFPKN